MGIGDFFKSIMRQGVRHDASFETQEQGIFM